MESGILAMTEKVYVKKFADNVFNTNPTLARLKKGEKSYDGGSSIVVPIEYAELASGGSFNGLDLLATTVNDIATQAQYEWRQYYVTLGWLAELACPKTSVKLGEPLKTAIPSQASKEEGVETKRRTPEMGEDIVQITNWFSLN